MEDVSGGELLVGSLLGALVVLGPSALLYAIMSAVFGTTSIFGISIFSLTVMAIGLVGSVLVARIYPGTDRLLRHSWLLVLVFIALPSVFISLVLAGTVSSDTAIEFVVGICTQLAYFLFMFVFVLYVHARGISLSLGRTRDSDADLRTGLFLRK